MQILAYFNRQECFTCKKKREKKGGLVEESVRKGGRKRGRNKRFTEQGKIIEEKTIKRQLCD